MQCTVSTDDVKRISIRRKTHRIARFTDDTVENGLVGAVAPRARQVLVPTREGEQDDQSRNQEDKLHSEGSLRRTCVGELMSASCGRQRGADDLKTLSLYHHLMTAQLIEDWLGGSSATRAFKQFSPLVTQTSASKKERAKHEILKPSQAETGRSGKTKVPSSMRFECELSSLRLI